MKPIRLHILSDLHNEFGRTFIPEVTDAEITLLAGDIDLSGRGLDWARENFSGNVLYVCGNHEFYKGNLDRTLEQLREDSDERVRVLNRDVVIVHGIRFLAATGWTDFTATGNAPLAQWEAERNMNDYVRIRQQRDYRRLTAERIRREAMLTAQWLQDELAKPFDGPTVVLTHHAPSMESLGSYHQRRYEPGHLDAAYANRWEGLCGPQVQLWVHGHTHLPVDYLINGTRVLSNPQGYPHDLAAGFRPELELVFENGHFVDNTPRQTKLHCITSSQLNA